MKCVLNPCPWPDCGKNEATLDSVRSDVGEIWAVTCPHCERSVEGKEGSRQAAAVAWNALPRTALAAPDRTAAADDPFYPMILKNPRPNFSITGNDREDKALACAQGLEAWAWVMMGNKPPQHFGMAMALLGSFLGCLATAEGLSEYSKNNILGQTPPKPDRLIGPPGKTP